MPLVTFGRSCFLLDPIWIVYNCFAHVQDMLFFLYMCNIYECSQLLIEFQNRNTFGRLCTWHSFRGCEVHPLPAQRPACSTVSSATLIFYLGSCYCLFNVVASSSGLFLICFFFFLFFRQSFFCLFLFFCICPFLYICQDEQNA